MEALQRPRLTANSCEQLVGLTHAPETQATLGKQLLVTNQTFPVSHPQWWAVLDIFAGEPGLPLFTPVIAPPSTRPRLRISAQPRSARPGTRTRFSFQVSVGRGARERMIANARIAFAGVTLSTNNRGTASAVVRLTGSGPTMARATARGLRDGSTFVMRTPTAGLG